MGMLPDGLTVGQRQLLRDKIRAAQAVAVAPAEKPESRRLVIGFPETDALGTHGLVLHRFPLPALGDGQGYVHITAGIFGGLAGDGGLGLRGVDIAGGIVGGRISRAAAQ